VLTQSASHSHPPVGGIFRFGKEGNCVIAEVHTGKKYGEEYERKET